LQRAPPLISLNTVTCSIAGALGLYVVPINLALATELAAENTLLVVPATPVANPHPPQPHSPTHSQKAPAVRQHRLIRKRQHAHACNSVRPVPCTPCCCPVRVGMFCGRVLYLYQHACQNHTSHTRHSVRNKHRHYALCVSTDWHIHKRQHRLVHKTAACVHAIVYAPSVLDPVPGVGVMAKRSQEWVKCEDRRPYYNNSSCSSPLAATPRPRLHDDSATHEDLGGGAQGPGPARVVGLLGLQCSARALFRTAPFK
jgi:hypothetical protein